MPESDFFISADALFQDGKLSSETEFVFANSFFNRSSQQDS